MSSIILIAIIPTHFPLIIEENSFKFATCYISLTYIQNPYPFLVKCSGAPMDSINWEAMGSYNVKEPGSNPTSATKLLHDSGQVI